VLGQQLDDLEVRHGASRGVSVSSDWRLGSERSRPDRRLDPPRPRPGSPADERQILPLQPMAADEPAQPVVCPPPSWLRPADRTYPGRAGARFPGRSASPPAVRPRSACTSVPPEWPAPGCTTEARGLVDDQHVLVLEGDPQVERLRDERLRGRRLELDLLPLPQPVGLLAGDPVDGHLAGREQPLGCSPRADLAEGREEPVEAKPRRVRRDADADQERGGAAVREQQRPEEDGDADDDRRNPPG